MFATGETVGLAVWIIDDTCLILTFLARLSLLAMRLETNLLQLLFSFQN